ncbi:MAG: hypothetical protein M9962_10690 [Oligoflexia bacterium]|nr:hypothetical protein [Oligoflexia bacterium]
MLKVLLALGLVFSFSAYAEVGPKKKIDCSLVKKAVADQKAAAIAAAGSEANIKVDENGNPINVDDAQ